MMIKAVIKRLIKKLPVAFTQNQRYDRQTKRVIKKVCKSNSNCIDVGAHKGEVLDDMLRYAPGGVHYAFEPIPDLYAALKEKYKALPRCRVSDVALSNVKGTASFNYVVSNPSYSGLIKRKYDRPHEKDRRITVATDLLDNILPADIPIDLMKIDVEGGELLVLEGAKATVARCKPVIIFEHGLGASDCYGATPEQVFSLLSGCGMKVNTMKRWLAGDEAFTEQAFNKRYYDRVDYYFIAYP